MSQFLRVPSLAPLLRCYFYSGWAFLIPYLAAYLLYYVTGWPVNPAGGIQNSVSSIQNPWVPSLLHLYWLLHAIHLILAGVALCSWWTENSAHCVQNASDSQFAPYSSYRLHLLTRIAPWAILALLFYIPGVYLEWPSDPWEHLRRINEWHILDQVAAHSSWKKSSYFLPYSLTGNTTGLLQIAWLNGYYTVGCLLVSWQYYRLARAVGLGTRASLVFVLLNALTFGNSAFSFYRYYGISSSILAQLGAVALTRVTMEAFGGSGIRLGTTNNENRIDSPAATFGANQGLVGSTPLQSAGSAFALLLLIAFNHIQGIGIAGLEILGIIVWRLIAWKRTMIGWLTLSAGALSVCAVIWFPRQPALDEILVPSGWLTPWYGFAIFSPHSPACERALQILGVFGVANLIAAVWLLYKNHIVGWLSLMPLVCLALPFITIPYSNVVISSTSADNILTFHRMLLGIPSMLAVVATFSTIARHRISPETVCRLATGALIAALAALMISGGSSPQYNRFWHCMVVSAPDLNLKELLTEYTRALPAVEDGAPRRYALTPPIGSALLAINPKLVVPGSFRAAGQNPLNTIQENMDFLGSGIRADRSTSPIPTKELAPQQMDASTWIVRRGPSVEFLQTAEASYPYLLQNPPGESCEVFSNALIPISPEKTYHLKMDIRQTAQTPGAVMLAVAWYDQQGRLLESNVKLPDGAGMPRGWSNGTYSYFGPGLVLLPTKWTTYSINFGRHEKAAIPHQARFIRIGALLNYRSTPSMVTQLSRVGLTEIPSPNIIFVLPDATSLTTTGSQAATLSTHWPRWQTIYDHAGTDELQTAVNRQRLSSPPPRHD